MDGLNPFGGSGADMRTLLRALLVAKLAQASGGNPMYEDTTAVGNDLGMTSPNGGSIGPPTGGQENNPWGPNVTSWPNFDPYAQQGIGDIPSNTMGGMSGSGIGFANNVGGGPGVGSAGMNLGDLLRPAATRAASLGPLGMAARLIAASISGGRGFDQNASPNSSRVGQPPMLGRMNTPGMLTNHDRRGAMQARNLF